MKWLREVLLTMLMERQTVTNPAVTFVQNMLRILPPPPIINHLASEGKTNHNIMMVSLLFYRKTNGRRTDGFKRTVHEEED